jgi:hypothetical protein
VILAFDGPSRGIVTEYRKLDSTRLPYSEYWRGKPGRLSPGCHAAARSVGVGIPAALRFGADEP